MKKYGQCLFACERIFSGIYLFWSHFIFFYFVSITTIIPPFFYFWNFVGLEILVTAV